MNELIMIARALSDPSRVRALLALQERRLCVCQINEILRFAPSTVSKHLAILKQAGLVKSSKEGRWVYYRLAGAEASPVAREAIRWIVGALGRSPQVSQDAAKLDAIVQLDPAIFAGDHLNHERKENE
jgi:DNA-binding transcriptional ArsR family regulator